MTDVKLHERQSYQTHSFPKFIFLNRSSCQTCFMLLHSEKIHIRAWCLRRIRYQDGVFKLYSSNPAAHSATFVKNIANFPWLSWEMRLAERSRHGDLRRRHFCQIFGQMLLAFGYTCTDLGLALGCSKTTISKVVCVRQQFSSSTGCPHCKLETNNCRSCHSC